MTLVDESAKITSSLSLLKIFIMGVLRRKNFQQNTHHYWRFDVRILRRAPIIMILRKERLDVILALSSTKVIFDCMH